jgi:hypothetical protein
MSKIFKIARLTANRRAASAMRKRGPEAPATGAGGGTFACWTPLADLLTLNPAWAGTRPRRPWAPLISPRLSPTLGAITPPQPGSPSCNQRPTFLSAALSSIVLMSARRSSESCRGEAQLNDDG